MMSLISLHISAKYGVSLSLYNVKYSEKDVQHHKFPYKGQVDFEVSSFEARIKVVALSNIGYNMLIAYQDFLKFNFIIVIFMFQVLTYTVSADTLEIIKHIFSDILNERLRS